MQSIHAAEPATQRTGQQALRYFATRGREPVAHFEASITEAYARQSGSRLLSQIDDLVAANHRKDESMAILLHELRSPLAAIQNAIVALRIRSNDEALQQRMHELIERQVRQLALLTSSLCQPSGHRVESPQLQLERIDLRTVIGRAAETVASELTQRLQQLSADLPESSTWVFGHAGRLEQVFVNLLVNASKYSEIGGKIAVSLQVCDGHAVVEVHDSGIGIAADALPNIFGLFMRADSMAVRTRTGLGIGLALVRSILDAHHGTVSAASAGVGQGSEFTVRLKLAT
jgi:two-component system CheB/CheR fusion protein